MCMLYYLLVSAIMCMEIILNLTYNNSKITALQAVRSIKAATREGMNSIADDNSRKSLSVLEDSVDTSSSDAAAAGAASAAVRAVQIAAATAVAAGGSFRGSLPGNALPKVSSQDRLLHLLESGRRDDSMSLASGMRKLEPLQACNPPASLTAVTHSPALPLSQVNHVPVDSFRGTAATCPAPLQLI